MAQKATRGSIGPATFAAVRKHIERGAKATEAFEKVAEETGRSRATVQTAYYRVARSMPDGGGVSLRPRKRVTAKARARGRATSSRRGDKQPSESIAAITKQLNDAAEALVARIGELERDLQSARADTRRLAKIERAFSA